MATESSASETAKTEVAKEQEQSSVTVSRRKALSAMVATGAVAGLALPEKWKKPVVNAVVLPAHAQASEGSSLDILAAYISSTNGNLYVLAQGTLTPACVAAGNLAGGETDGSSLMSQCLVTGGATLYSEDYLGWGCSPSTALISGCLISMSIRVMASSHNLSPGDTITLRNEFGGECITTAVATVV